jgi:outer membrane protein OmpA-like peptidoglycan-associated protein
MSIKKLIFVILFSLIISLLVVSGCATKSEAVIDEPKEVPEEKGVVKEEKVEESVEKVEEIQEEEEPDIKIVDKIEEGKKITTYSFRVEFDLDSDVIRRDYFGNVQEALDFLNANPNTEIVKVLIEGRADSSGSESHNYALARRRANRVKQLLMDELNIDSDIIETRSFGEGNPITSNKTEAGRQKNRSAVVTVSLNY